MDHTKVAKIADLANIEIDSDKIESYQSELGAILEYVEKIEELDLEDVEPTTHAASGFSHLRDDDVEKTLDRDEALSNAPDSQEGQFRVPKIVEE